MRISAVSALFPAPGNTDGHLAIRQQANGVGAATQIALLLPVLVAVMAPFAIVAAEAIAEPAARDRLAAAPINTLTALVGVAIWFLMFGIPAVRALRRIGWSRQIDIADRMVTVRDTSPFGARSRTEPVSAFEGISHHVRTTLSGTRHELVLVHPDRPESLLLDMNETISQEDAEALARRLELPLLQSGVLFRSKARLAWPTVSLPLVLKAQQA